MLHELAVTADTIACTTKRGEKERILADFLASLDDASLERAVVFLTGSPFPRRDQRVTGVGYATIADAFTEATGVPAEALREAYPRHADLGDTVGEVFPSVSRTISIVEAGEWFDRLASAQGTVEKKTALAGLFRKVDARQARLIVKILQGELRIGLQEGLVLSALAKAFRRDLDAVRRANMLTGDVGAAALLAKSGTLETAALALFQPFAFMLAQPEEDPEEIVAALGPGAFADDKYDGIRAQVHTDGAAVRIYSRTLDDVTHRFPEVESAARQLARAAVLDGEIVAWRGGIRPFALLQKRLGRRNVGPKLIAEAPVAYFAFDLLHLDGETLFETPLAERLRRLHGLIPAGSETIRRSVQSPIRDAAHVEELFDQARARANEGLVIKDPGSIYTPGRRGKSWLKYKKALATLDCVVTYAQWGNGKRRNVLSDLTFGILREGEIVNVGKAYTGLTDAEIAEMTELFRSIGTWDGWRFRIPPRVVLEIAFDRIQESGRHKAGYALRFPRIVRIRDDKSPAEISTIEDVRRIYEGQLHREAQRGD